MRAALQQDEPRPSENAVSRISVRAAVFHLLRSFGISKVFGNPGSTELPMFREWPPDMDYVLGLQESIVVAMADGYAQATGNAAFVNLHSAAGLGHSMGSLYTAAANNSPLVITAGQQVRSMLPMEPYLAAREPTELPKPYVKWAVEPARAEDVPKAIARAYYLAMQEPKGPVFVSVPADDWDVLTERVEARKVVSARQPSTQDIEPVISALNAAMRPAFVVGADVDRSGSWDAMVQLAERHRAAVWASPMSSRASFPESHRLFSGFLPASSQALSEVLSNYDVVIVLGAPAFTYHVDSPGRPLGAGTALFQIVNDGHQAAWSPHGTSLLGNVAATARLLVEGSNPRERPDPAPRTDAPVIGPSDLISVPFLLQTLARLRPESSIIVEEAPSSRPAVQQYLPIDRSSGFFAGASGGLGYGLPAAVGIALADRQRKVIALIGDGSSMYSIQALWTAAQLGLPLTIIIVNNGGYAALEEFARVFGVQPIGTCLGGLDFELLARGQGCAAVRVVRSQDLPGALAGALSSPGPCLVDVLIGA